MSSIGYVVMQEAFSLESVIMVGDGATDLEARLEGAAELFIGYVPGCITLLCSEPYMRVHDRKCIPLRMVSVFHSHRYGGVVERKNIAEKADWYIYDIKQFINALKS